MTNISNRRSVLRQPFLWLAFAFCFTGLSASTSRAASAQSSAGAFGSVDVQKVLAGFTKKAALDQQITDLNTKLDAEFKQQVNSPMLSATQEQELGTLLAKDAPTDADKARITELEAISQKDADELTSLQQVKDPTDDQKSRLAVLTKEQQDGQAVLQSTADAYRAQVQAENDKLSAQLSDMVKTAISAVAQQKGLAVVFDSQVAIYTANDITDAVTKQLNK